MDKSGYFALDTNALPWEERLNPHVPGPIYRKVLHTVRRFGYKIGES